MEKYRLLFETVFKRELTGEDTVGYLEKLTAEHPYFSAAQFYLLQLSGKDTPAYKIQAKRTAALFNNTYWLNFQLLEAGINNEAPAYSAGNIETVVENIPEEKTVEPAAIEIKEEESFVEEIAATENIIETAEPLEPIPEQSAIEMETPLATDAVEEIVIDEPVTPEATVNIQEEQINEIEAEPLADEAIVEYPVKEAAIEEPGLLIETNNEPSIKEELVEEQQAEAGIIAEATVEDIAEINNTEATAESINEPIVAAETIPVMITAALTPNESNQELLFEPLHTSDYFASVGIKLSEEEKTGDKLGKQLKSFTDWLKTMKKTHAEQLAQVTKPAALEAAGTNSSIQKLAERSNQENDIITEAMADVLLQQDRKDKALEILQKLSLLNPTKSAYFAAKINQIKEK